jgi:tryptophan synthase alpha chain
MSEPAISKTAAAPKSAAQARTRISRRFRELAEAGELGLVAYVTAGDPSLAATEKIVLAAAKAGADVIELGVPFSDPVADGPTIQRASERALRNGTTLAGVIDLVRRIRKHSDVPLVLFSYFNPILQMGLEKFAAEAAAAGADGVLATDLTLEEAAEYRAILHAHALDTIFLVAPTSTDSRLEQIANASSGFLYVISRAGVTGAREALPAELPGLVRRVRKFTSLPIAVGFGISLPTHVTVLGGIADAAVVGSALVAEIEKAASPEAAVEAVAEQIRILKMAAREGVSRRTLEANPGAMNG